MVRLKNRYLLVHILYPSSSNETTTKQTPSTTIPNVVRFHQPTSDALTPHLLTRTIRSEIASLYGDYGAGVTSSSLSIKYLSPATSTFILRVSRAHYRLAWAALSFITKLPPTGRTCVMRVVRVSGTIRKAEEEAIRRARQSALRARAAMSTWEVGHALREDARGVGMGKDEVREQGRGEVRVDGSDEDEDEDEDDEDDDDDGGGLSDSG